MYGDPVYTHNYIISIKTTCRMALVGDIIMVEFNQARNEQFSLKSDKDKFTNFCVSRGLRYIIPKEKDINKEQQK